MLFRSCSYAFLVPSSFNFFLCGDTGYPNKFPLFRQIGDALGPFDLACIPIGAYEPQEMNKDSHCNPDEALRIHKDLHSNRSIGIHWGSFQLAEESLGAPLRDLEEAIRREEEQEQKFGFDVKELSSPSPQYENSAQFSSLINFGVLEHGGTLILKNEKSSSETTE